MCRQGSCGWWSWDERSSSKTAERRVININVDNVDNTQHKPSLYGLAIRMPMLSTFREWGSIHTEDIYQMWQ